MTELLWMLGILLTYLLILIYSVRNKKAFVKAETPMEQLKRMRTEDYWNNPVANEIRRQRDGKR